MSVSFMDSFDHYTALAGANGKYASAGLSSAIVSGPQRTGTACLQVISAAFGPYRAIPPTTDVLIASAYYMSGGTPAWCYELGNSGANAGSSGIAGLYINGDGSLAAGQPWFPGPAKLFASTVPGLFQFNSYNMLGFRVTGFHTLNTRFRIWCNGVLVLDQSGFDTKTGAAGPDFCNGFELFGAGGNATTCYHDDLYVLDCTSAPNNNYLGALRIYASVPVANGAVAWTPLAGTNWQNVDTIPPTGTPYNSSVMPGQVDQYLHPLPGAVPSNSTLFAVQHCQDLQAVGGSRSVTSDIAGVPNAGAVALSLGFLIDTWPYDINPATAAPWLASDFPLLAGPAVTA